MKYLWFIPLLGLLGACKQDEVRSQTAAQPTSAPPPARPSDTRPVIACFGDSLTAGFGVDHSYPELLQKELDRRGLHYRVVNLGVSGDTTQDGLDRISLVTAERPQLVIVEFGANDGLRGQPVSNMEKNLGQMIETLQQSGIRVVLAAITLPPNYGPDYIRKFDAVYSSMAARYKVPLIPFLLAGVAGNPKLMQQDGLHPNAAGTPIVTANVMRTLEPLLKSE